MLDVDGAGGMHVVMDFEDFFVDARSGGEWVLNALGEEVASVEVIDDENGKRVKIHLASGKQINAERVLYSIGRTGSTHKS